jgi:hypothetical protein
MTLLWHLSIAVGHHRHRHRHRLFRRADMLADLGRHRHRQQQLNIQHCQVY